MMNRLGLIVALPALAAASVASANVTVIRNSTPATHATLITFDEVGGPTGLNPANDAWAAQGMSFIGSGEGNRFVGDNSGTISNATNSFYGPFGVFMEFSGDLTAASLQFWDTSGPASPFGGGVGVFVFNNGVEVASTFGNGTLTDTNSWVHVSTTDGMVFDEIRVLGFGFPADSFVDNISFVPAPGALALLGLGGACTLRRRRR